MTYCMKRDQLFVCLFYKRSTITETLFKLISKTIFLLLKLRNKYVYHWQGAPHYWAAEHTLLMMQNLGMHIPKDAEPNRAGHENHTFQR